MTTNSKQLHLTPRDMAFCALFTALITIGAYIRVPIPIIPFTMQYPFTQLAGLLLGARLGGLSACCYVALGLLGAPVFAEGGGFAYVLKPSFGYILGFCIGTYVTGLIANKTPQPTFKRLLAANFAGLLIVYGCGALYCWLISSVYLGQALGFRKLITTCVLLLIPGDAAFSVFSALLGHRLLPALRQMRR